MCLLDAGASALWDLQATGLTPADLTELLVARFALPPEQARTQVAALMNDWRHAGLLDADEAAANWRLGAPDDPVWPAPRPRPLEPAAWALQVADRRVGLSAEDATVRRHLNALLVPATRVGEPCEVDHALQLRGSTKAWQLALEGAPLEQGQGLDAALIATLATLTELGCRPAERLIVLHGAGLVTADGRGLLLVAPGGSGKTTLAAALEASGYGLLSDDVVPVGWDGALWGLGLPLCLKPGSWPVLTARRPTLARMPTRHRFGTEVRFLPALHPRPVRAASVGALFLSQYRPDAPPECVPIGPEQALRGLIEAESVLRDLTQEKLDALARWISAIAAYRLQYPDLDQAHALIETRLRPQAPPRRPSDHR
nr:PqqD family peptide modification chaperone [Thiocapsa imhoffii]